MASTELDNLTDAEIRKKFKEFGIGVGPVTATTRKTLLKKLKQLYEDPNLSVTLSNSALWQSNSGDESDESSKRSRSTGRRKTMPSPRTPGRSPSRKSPARAANKVTPLANSTFVEPVPPKPKSPPAERRSSRRATPDRSRNMYNDAANVISPPLFDGRDFNGYLSPTAKDTNDEIRKRTSYTSPSSSLFSSSIGLDNQPFASDFVKRLSATKSPLKTDYSTPVITSKLLDVKESDDEDNPGPAPVYAKFSQGPYGRKSDTSYAKCKNRGYSNDVWLSLDSPISAVLLVILVLFFIIIGMLYTNMHVSDTNIGFTSEVRYPPCKEEKHVSGINCITENDKELVKHCFNLLLTDINDRLTKMPCGHKGTLSYTDDDIIKVLIENDKSLSIYVVEKIINHLKVVFDNNEQLKVSPTKDGIIVEQPQMSYYCKIVVHLMTGFDYAIKGAILVFIIYMAIKFWLRREARHKEEVYKLVSSIIDIVSTKALNQDSFIPISHVRDQLIEPKDRNRKSKLWNDALALLENDSRLRKEVQDVEGEEFLVWRWLASSLSAKKEKAWQGQAFDTMEGSVNSLQHSPTACLKIRHMFDPDQEQGEDWVNTVVKAILEKCEKAKILHIVVDKKSKEGCVYIKCASTLDAGIAYRSLHGFWYNTNLVTVKYIREKRYLERFPESANYTQQLRPDYN